MSEKADVDMTRPLKQWRVSVSQVGVDVCDFPHSMADGIPAASHDMFHGSFGGRM